MKNVLTTYFFRRWKENIKKPATSKLSMLTIFSILKLSSNLMQSSVTAIKSPEFGA